MTAGEAAPGHAGRHDGPLRGVRVLVPRAAAQAGELSRRIRRLGGEAVECPTIEIRPGDTAALTAALADLAAGRFVAVCLTSANGVAALADAAVAAGLRPGELLGSVTVAAVGPGTARALRHHFGRDADVVPPRSTTHALGEALPNGSGRVLLPRADIATATLPEILRARGYDPVEVVAYVTARPDSLPADVLTALDRGAIDLLAFTSASTVRNFTALLGDRPVAARVVSIGPVTSAACRDAGLTVAAEARAHDLDGLVEALVEVVAAGR